MPSTPGLLSILPSINQKDRVPSEFDVSRVSLTMPRVLQLSRFGKLPQQRFQHSLVAMRRESFLDDSQEAPNAQNDDLK